MFINTSIVPRVLIGLLVAAYLVLGYFAFLLLYPFETIIAHNEPFPIKNAPVVAGKVVIYTVDYCRYTDVDAEVVRTLVGSVSISLGKTDSHLERGCFTKDIADSVIPSFAPPGRYYIQIDSNYRINKLRSIEKHFRTAEFDVISPPNSPLQSSTATQNNQGISSVQSPSTAGTEPVHAPSSNQQVATTAPPSQTQSTAPPKQTSPPTSNPPTTSSPPPDNKDPVQKVVNTVLKPVDGVLQGVVSLLRP